MAKVKGPLFSMDARGQIAKSLVYMGWKGLKTVRQYVIPSNPSTEDQQTQRGYFKAAVEEWHTEGYTALDVAAWDLYALSLKVAQSGFNVYMKLRVRAKVALKTWLKLVNITIGAPTATGCVVTVATDTDQTLSLYYGTSKTSMFGEVVGTWELGTTTFNITGLSPEVEYFFYIKTKLATGAERTGIYSFKTAAA